MVIFFHTKIIILHESCSIQLYVLSLCAISSFAGDAKPIKNLRFLMKKVREYVGEEITGSIPVRTAKSVDREQILYTRFKFRYQPGSLPELIYGLY